MILATAALVTATSLFSATAFSNDYVERSEMGTITTETASNRSAAFKLGAGKLAMLQSSSPEQLSEHIRVFSIDTDESSVTLSNNAFVTVQERLGANGKLGYVALVNFELNYLEEDDSDDDH